MLVNPKQGKVANVINERELAINIGLQDGVKSGMKFKVVADQPTEIKDPETDEVLGVVDREKVRVEVTELYERFSVCRTYRIFSTGGGLLAAAARFPAKTLFEEPTAKIETLRADKSSYLPPLAESQSFVKRGDRVIEIDDNDPYA